mmetsp:Transcript_50283/g.129458  ORF Transcript_50283/g.129458 Transcript_50283/m.129458 type:complete len:104 (-) Transcript_50283:1647-1958(-)
MHLFARHFAIGKLTPSKLFLPMAAHKPYKKNFEIALATIRYVADETGPSTKIKAAQRNERIAIVFFRPSRVSIRKAATMIPGTFPVVDRKISSYIDMFPMPLA